MLIFANTVIVNKDNLSICVKSSSKMSYARERLIWQLKLLKIDWISDQLNISL